MAKLASARCKPDGLLVVPADGVLGFLHPLPVAALWGVGEQTGQVLARLGLRTVGDIARTPLGDAAARARRRPPARTCPRWPGAATSAPVVEPRVPEKSIGAEETFASDVDDPELIRRELLRLSGRTARGLRSAGALARTVVVKLRLANFTTITRSRTLPEPTDVAPTIYATACALYAASGLDRGPGCGWSGCGPPGLVPAVPARHPAGARRAGGGLARGRAGRWTRSRAVRGRCGAARPPWSDGDSGTAATGRGRRTTAA